jgi:O-antigen/teichoic acid export membrane protein
MPGIDTREKTRLMRDSTIHALGLVLSSVAGLILVPLMVHGLGIEAYGLWAAAMAAIGIFGAFDLGLRLIIVRDLAGDPHSSRAPAVRMMLWINFTLGTLAAAAIALGGSVASSRLHLSAGAQTIAPLVFTLAGANCFFDQLIAWVLSVLAGLRRFDLLNLFSISLSILRLALFAGALALGKGVVAIFGLQLSISALSALGGLAFIAFSVPDLRPRLEPLRWEILREPLGFGALSQAATSISSLQMPISTLLISLINGAAAVTPFTIGQKFPGLVSGLTWRTSEVFFPVASRQLHGSELDSEAFLSAITRWLILLTAPCALGLSIIAPLLLRTWMGEVNPIALAVLRIAAISLIVETVIPGSVQLFFGASETRPVLAANLATLLADVALALLLLPRIGATGAAWATLGSTTLAAVLFIVLAATKRSVSPTAVLTQTFRRLIPAILVTLLPGYFFARTVGSRSWTAIIGIVILSAALYIAILWRYAASRDEKQFLATVLRFPKSPASKSAAGG